MQTAELRLETLHLMCPDLVDEFAKVMTQLVKDCRDRPAVNKDRKLILTFHIAPHENDPEDVIIAPVVSSKQPSRQLEVHRARTGRTGQLMFDFGSTEEAA